MPTAFYSHPDCRRHQMGRGHPECPERLDAIDDFLLASGLTECLARVDPGATAEYLKLTNQVHRLVSPAEMGEFFKVIGFAKGLVSPITAFQTARPLPL